MNGPVLKSLKTKRSGPKSEKKIGRAGLVPKFQFPFRAGPGPVWQIRPVQGKD